MSRKAQPMSAAIALVMAMGLTIAILILLEHRCPNCGRTFSSDTTLLERESYQTNSLFTQNFKHPVSVRHYYRCRNCSHEWEKVITHPN